MKQDWTRYPGDNIKERRLSYSRTSMDNRSGTPFLVFVTSYRKE